MAQGDEINKAGQTGKGNETAFHYSILILSILIAAAVLRHQAANPVSHTGIPHLQISNASSMSSQSGSTLLSRGHLPPCLGTMPGFLYFPPEISFQNLIKSP